MDRSQVMDQHEFRDEKEVSPKSRWHFQPDDDNAPDLFFSTELEACAAQQGYRIAKGFNPFTGN